MNGITYSWLVSADDQAASFRFLYSCETPVVVEGGATFFDYTLSSPVSIAYKNSPGGASCSLYTFIATQNSTSLRIESCSRMYPPNDAYYFTHSVVFQSGDVGWICSSITPILLSGSYSNFSVTPQPGSVCDCGRNYIPPTTTTTSTTTAMSLTQSWLSRRNCCPTSPPPFTYSNFDLTAFTPLPGKSWIQTVGLDKFCWRLINPTSIYNPSYQKHTGTLFNDCNDCLTSNSLVCTTTTTTSTTTIFQQTPPGTSNCHCGSFECVRYVIDGQDGDSIRWRECTISQNQFPIRSHFNFYYFYDTETIEICSCSANLSVVSGNPIINGVQWPGLIPNGDICSKKTSDCEVCKSFFVELGENIRNSGRPVLVEYDSCYAPDGGYTNPQKTMWPVSAGTTFSGLPVPLPIWAPNPMNGSTLFGRKTHVYQICSCGNTKTPDDVANFKSPTISVWDGSSWVLSPRSLTQSSAYLGGVEHFIWQSCNGGTCSCYNYSPCTTTTTTMNPCPSCVPTVIGASGPGFTNIIYEGCDTLVKHNMRTDYLFTGATSSICSCQRCRQWKVRPLTGADALPYVHCCDPVFEQSGYSVPSWHSSTLYNLFPITCKSYTLTSNTATTFQYLDCTDSRVKYIRVQYGTNPTICASTVSFFDEGAVFNITSGSNCGTSSVNICVSGQYYGNLSPDHSNFSLVPPGAFTFSDMGSCSCITSDNRYKNNTYYNFQFPGVELEYLSVTFSSSATCSDRIITQVNPPQPVIPPCCDCRVYYVSNLSNGDRIDYKPCDSNRLNISQMSLSMPQINFTGTTLSTGSFSVRVSATGFYGVGSFSIVFNHRNLTFVTASILQSSLVTDGRIATSGSFSRFAWQNASGTNFGNGDIVNFTFSGAYSANLEFMIGNRYAYNNQSSDYYLVYTDCSGISRVDILAPNNAYYIRDNVTYTLNGASYSFCASGFVEEYDTGNNNWCPNVPCISATDSFYQNTNISLLSGGTRTIYYSINDGFVKYPGMPLPGSNKNSKPPSFPSFP